MAIEKLLTEQFDEIISVDQAQKKQIYINTIMHSKVYTLDSITSVNIGSIFYKIIYTGAPKAGESVLYTRDTDWSTYLTFAISDTNVAAGNTLTFNATYGKSLNLIQYKDRVITNIIFGDNIVLQSKVYQLPQDEISNDYYITNQITTSGTPPYALTTPGRLHITKGWQGKYFVNYCKKICTKFIIELSSNLRRSESSIICHGTRWNSSDGSYKDTRGFVSKLYSTTMNISFNKQNVEYIVNDIKINDGNWIGLELRQEPVEDGSSVYVPKLYMISNIDAEIVDKSSVGKKFNLKDSVLLMQGFVGDLLDIYNFSLEISEMNMDFTDTEDIIIEPYVIDQYPLKYIPET